MPKQRIVELVHKYLSLFHRSLREFNTLFPDNNNLIGINVDQTNPERFLAQLAPALAARSAAGREMLEQYRGTGLPIAFAGSTIGLDPVEAWQAILGGSIAIDACWGEKRERDSAASLLRDRPPLILDPMTFWIAGVLGLLDPLASTFGQPGITATCIELLAKRERSASDNLARGRGVMFERDGNIGFVQPTDEEKRAPAELASRLLAWASGRMPSWSQLSPRGTPKAGSPTPGGISTSIDNGHDRRSERERTCPSVRGQAAASTQRGGRRAQLRLATACNLSLPLGRESFQERLRRHGYRSRLVGPFTHIP